MTERQDDHRVSLAPLDPQDALRALLAVDPESEPDRDEGDDQESNDN